MKSICILLQNHYDSDIRVRRKAEALVDAGYRVDVLALRAADATDKTYTLNGVRVFTISLGKKRGSLARYAFEYLMFFVWSLWKLSSLMGREHYDAVDVNNLPDFLVFAAAYAKWRGAKVIFDMHEITPEFYVSKYGIREDSMLVRLLKWVERRSFAFADHVIAINEPILQLLRSRGLDGAKATVIMNSADEAMFADVQKQAAAASPTAPAFVMMYHGTLTRLYGLDLAIRAFALASADMPGAEFWILGGGPEKPALQKLADELGLSKKVKFQGTVPPQEIGRWLTQCDIGVLATRQDVFLDYSFSNKLSEYVILGKAVAASRLKAIRYYFSESALAFFQPNDPADIAKVMVQLYRRPDLRRQLASNAAREYAPISWGIMRERYLGMMNTLLPQEIELGVPVQAADSDVAVR